MKNQNKKMPILLGIVLCLCIAAGAGYLLRNAYLLKKNNRQLDEQFTKELEESQKTIDQLKEQKAELETDIQKVEEERNHVSIEESQQTREPSEPTPIPLRAGILDCQPGEILPAETLYLDNPGIYFTASPIPEGEEICLRIMDLLPGDADSVPFGNLRYLKMPYYQQNGEIHVGEMVVTSALSQTVLDTFLDLFQKKQSFPSMELKDNLWIEETDLAHITETYLSSE